MDVLLDLPAEERNELETGLAPSLQDYTGYPWADGRNIVFREGGPRTMRGWEEVIEVSTEDEVTALAQAYIQDTGEKRLYIHCGRAFYRWNAESGLVSIMGPFTDSVSMTVFGTWVILVSYSATEAPQVYKWKGGNTTTLNLAEGEAWNAKIARTIGPHVVLFNILSDNPVVPATEGNRILWSGEDDAEEWDIADPDTGAGDLWLRDLGSDIEAAVPIGDLTAVYTKDGMALLEYVGWPDYFTIKKVLANIGAVGMNSVVEAGRMNYGISRQGAWVTDGQDAQYIDSTAIREFLLEDVNWDYADKICGYHDEAEEMIVWYYPSGSSESNDAGIGFNYTKQIWTRFDHGRSAALTRAVFDYPITATGTVYYQGKGDNADGTAIESWVQTQPFSLGVPEQMKRIQKVVLYAEKDNTLTLSVGLQDELGDTVEWVHEAEAAEVNHILDREAPYLVMKLHSDTGPWALSGFRLIGAMGGRVT